MNHESLQRKLVHLEEEIRLAESASLPGTAILPQLSLSLDEAIRVAANIRNRLAGVSRPQGKQAYHVSKRPTDTVATD